MLPEALTTHDSETERRRWKIVNRSTCRDVGPAGCLVLWASVETGECEISWDRGDGKRESQKHSLGPSGLRIVIR